MRKLNNEAYKELLKSVKPEYEKEAIWTTIDAELGKKRKRRFLWIFFLGLGFATTLGWFSWGNYFDQLATQTPGQTPILEAIKDNDTKSDKSSITDIPSKVVSSTTDTEELQSSFAVKENVPKSTTLNEKQSINSSGINKKQSVFSRSEKKTEIAKNLFEENTYVATNEKTVGIWEAVTLSSASTALSPAAAKLMSQKSQREAIADIEQLKSLFRELSLPSHTMHGLALDLVTGSSAVLGKREASRKFFSIALSYSRPATTFTALVPEGQDFTKLMSASHTDLYHTGLALNYGFRFPSGIELSTGLQIDRTVTRFNYSTISSSVDSIAVDDAHYFDYVDGTQGSFPGYLMKTTTDTRRIQHYNHSYRLGLTIGLGYNLRLGENISFTPRISGYVLPLTFSDGRTLIPGPEIAANDETKHSVFQYAFGGQFSYSSKAGLELFLGGQYRRDLSSASSSGLMGRRESLAGVQLGLRLGL